MPIFVVRNFFRGCFGSCSNNRACTIQFEYLSSLSHFSHMSGIATSNCIKVELVIRARLLRLEWLYSSYIYKTCDLVLK